MLYWAMPDKKSEPNDCKVIMLKIVLEQVFLLMLFIGVGYGLCKAKMVDSKQAKLLSGLELYVFLPATVFNTFSTQFTVVYIREQYPLMLLSVGILVVLALASLPVSRWITKDSYERNVYAYSLTMPNYGYMGYALAGGIFGSEVLLNVMLFSLPLSFYIYTVGYSSLTKTRFSLKKLINPVMVTMLVGAIVGLSGVQMPVVVNTFADKAAACMAPVSMLLTGMVIAEFRLKTLLSDKRSYVVSALRLLVIPCGLALALRWLSLEEVIVPTLMVYAMPCGLNTIVFPRLVNENCETGASLAVVSSLLCCLTIPFCLYLFT